MKVYVRRRQGRDERLAAFAHDIRTPLCCVTGAAQMALLQSRKGADVSEQMENILLAVRTMDRMLCQLCQAQSCPGCAPFTQKMLLRELLALFGESARGKDQVLSVDLTALGEGTYRADYAALVRILSNLMSNAVKYTPPGGRIELRAAAEGGGVFGFTVRDSGPGMRPEFLGRVFAPFERAKETAHLPGRGLGLAIARELTQRMGGEISVSSRWGEGTAFTVRVPLEKEKR